LGALGNRCAVETGKKVHLMKDYREVLDKPAPGVLSSFENEADLMKS
jgi:hypothetical protein